MWDEAGAAALPPPAPAAPAFRTKRLLLAVLAGGVAAGLLTLAVPRMVGNLLVAPASPILRKVQLQQDISPDEMAAAIAALESSARWTNDSQIRTDLGLLNLLAAERLPEGDLATIERVAAARGWLKQGLARGPANPYAWARLAYAEATLGGWTPFAVVCLRMSLLTAPFEPGLLWSRLRLGMLAWPKLKPDDRRLIERQIEFAWAKDAAALGNLARELNFIDPVRAVLQSHPDDLAAFDAFLAAPAAPAP